FLVGYRKVPGTEPNLKPDLINLYIPNDKVVLKVDVNYKTYVGGSDCTTLDDHPRKTTVWFHDIARRTLFLSAVLNRAVDDGPPGLHSRPFQPIQQVVGVGEDLLRQLRLLLLRQLREHQIV